MGLVMSFIWPWMLWSLALLPLLVAFYIYQQQRRQRLIASRSISGLFSGTVKRAPDAQRHLPAVLFLAGLSVLLVALARPQTVVNLPRVEGTVILTFDVSGSMAADDLKPNRMEAAKAAARSFVQQQPATVQIGVVAFSDSGLIVQPPTNDQQAVLATIDRLRPERGTSLAHGIFASLDAIAGTPNSLPVAPDAPTSTPAPTPTPLPRGSYTSAVIVLLTDGENTAPPDPLVAAQAAMDRGVRIYTIGVGSPTGTTLEVEGFLVHTRLDENTLRQISQLTQGAYFYAESEQDLNAIYENIAPELVIRPEKTEVTPIFAGVSILIFLIGGAFSLLWFNRLP